MTNGLVPPADTCVTNRLVPLTDACMTNGLVPLADARMANVLMALEVQGGGGSGWEGGQLCTGCKTGRLLGVRGGAGC